MRFLFPILLLTLSPLYSNETVESIIADGDFENVKLGESNGWPAGKGLSVEEEDGNHFLRLESPEPGAQIQSYRKISLPGGIQKINVSFRARFVDLIPGTENWHTGRVIVHFKDGNGTTLQPAPKPFAFKGKSDGWIDKSAEMDVPEGTDHMELLIGLFQVSQGTLDIDDFVISPVNP